MIRAVGVVVPAHDEEDLLPFCLASLHDAAQALRGTQAHLIVVADACRDLTAQVARRDGASVVTVGARNVGAARAAGVRDVLRKTRHLDPADVWLATTDADSVVPADWLRRQADYADQGWDAVAGTIRVADWSGYQPATRTLFSERYDGGTASHSHVHGANLGFRASAYLQAGGFPEEPTAEDHAFVSALTTCGCRVLRTRALPVATSARRESRAPHGFSRYLAELDSAPASTGPDTTSRACLAGLEGPG